MGSEVQFVGNYGHGAARCVLKSIQSVSSFADLCTRTNARYPFDAIDLMCLYYACNLTVDFLSL